ncbi:hypothetical protein SLE2022_252030 [Rubroshorea leprosula]
MRNRKKAAIVPSSSDIRPIEAGWPPGNACIFLQLSRAAVMDILSRLPITTLLTCRCVCKRFLHLISDPEFAQLHLTRSAVSIMIKTLPPVNGSKRLQVAQIEDNGAGFEVRKMEFTAKDSLPTCDFGHMNSCNGLICLAGFEKDDPVYVCNPILGEYITLTSPSKGRHRGSFLGLGYSAVTDQFKVLQTFYPLNESDHRYVEVEICTIGTATWRSIGVGPKDLVTLPFNSFLNGALHWSTCTPNGSQFIHTFSFVTERFGTVPPPPHFSQEDMKFSDFLRIGVLGGCLYAIFFENSLRLDIWVMKEYGVRESWTKQFAVENLYPRKHSWDLYEPVVVLNNGEILLVYNNDLVVCYHPKRKCLRGTKMFRTRSQFNAIAYTPSLVSLYAVAKGEQISRTRGTGKYERLAAENAQSCVTCGAPLFNSDYSLACFPGATSYSSDSNGRNSDLVCVNCAKHLLGPSRDATQKSFLSLWSL